MGYSGYTGKGYGKDGYNKGKGYGKDGGYKGKGYGNDSGYKGYGKDGGYKGKGFGKDSGYKGDGKGTGGFQGHCHWCGEWGHSQSRCQMKDKYMNELRANGKGYGKGGKGNNMGTDNVEDPAKQLESLEATGGYRTLCNLEHRRGVVVSNRFAALEAEEQNEEYDQPPGIEGFIAVARKSLNKAKKATAKLRSSSSSEIASTNQFLNRKVRGGKFLKTVDSLELNAVGSNEYMKGMMITIDSGASENVIGPSMAPGTPILPSAGSRAGVQYITANGMTMPNMGEKHLHVLTCEGHKCLLNMQVTDVNKPLMSVARICDAGHEVVFSARGGVIRHLTTGQETKFNRVDNVYRLQVDVVGEPDFARPGAQ
jgi:hypothetical protein